MAKKTKSIVDELRQQLSTGKMQEQVALQYRMSGGSPEKAVNETLTLSSTGNMTVQVTDKLKAMKEGEASEKLDQKAAQEIWQLVLNNVDKMVPAEQARFIPDSTIGAVSFFVGDKKETYYFDADEDICQHQKKPVSPDLLDMVNRFREIESHCIAQQEEC